MRSFGFLMMALGLMVCVYALAYDTSVAGSSSYLESSSRISNIGRISNRELLGITSVCMILFGGVLLLASWLEELVAKVDALRLPVQAEQTDPNAEGEAAAAPQPKRVRDLEKPWAN